MENKTTAFIVGIVIVGVSIVLGIYSARGWGMNSGMRGMHGSASLTTGDGMMGMNNRMMGNVDQHFIEQMIPHHEGAIAMAQIALDRTKRPEIKSLAEGIIQAQEREIADMQSWYEKWFGVQVPATSQGMQGMGHGSMVHMGGMSGDLERLQSAAQFDKEFINQMIPHHEMAVMMATMLQSGTRRPEMKTLADQIITSQSREIEMMLSWRKDWYGY